jgi:glutamate dehydrogenase
MTSQGRAKDSRIASALKLLERQKSGTLARELAGPLFARANSDDVASLSPETLALLVRSAADALREHRPGKPIVRVGSLMEKQKRADLGVVEVVSDNMPFLVDSTLAELHHSNADIRLVVHPILPVERDAGGRVTGIPALAPDKAAGRAEASLIQVTIGALSGTAENEIRDRLSATLRDVHAAVTGWRAMLARVEAAIAAYQANPPPVGKGEIDEAIALLRWLTEDDFTFLGIREYAYAGGELQRSTKPGLGVLADADRRIFGKGNETLTLTPAIREFLAGPELLIIGKTNARSRVHRQVYMDYVGVKLFGRDGKLAGELRIVGLFTSTAYTRSVRSIPYIRRKVERVIERAGYASDSHSGKALLNILETWPRDELFQIDESLLARFAADVMALEERPRVRVLVRRDKFDRYVSALVYVPRDRYTTETRIAIGEYLSRTFNAHVSAYYPSFPEGLFTRVHFILGRDAGDPTDVPRETLEQAVTAIVRSWRDGLRETLDGAHGTAEGARLFNRYGRAFPDSYRNDFSPRMALRDIEALEGLADERVISVDVYRPDGANPSFLSLRIVHLNRPIDLSTRVPMLENFGFRVIDERTYRLEPDTGRFSAFVHDMELETVAGMPIDVDTLGAPLREAFLAVWSGRAESDGYNALVVNAGLDWREVVLLRTISRYLKQAGVTYSQGYMAATLNKHADIAVEIVRRFVALFRPPRGNPREADALAAVIDGALASVDSLDEDRILRRFANVVEATVRTNYFRSFNAGDANPVLTLKLESAKIEELPSPVPFREIIVYSPRVEGVHLRFGRIARGGIRWSDRREDYRTEVLGLVKAQQIKNAVIVPVGAKGGFVPKQLPAGPRDAIMAEGTAAYQIYISSLLDITDNIDGSRMVPPENVVRREGDDPYFVVAADKGTATFSDTANAISQSCHFWLDDAFASGGSAGYDHKAMGITARGAWEAVKRHFREMDIDIQTTPFTVAGVGDMSGDVFGNGMLLSPVTRLVAAFDHRDIFLDPDPDPKLGLKERRRLFKLPRSSWQDYDKALISTGGGVFSRADKSIPISRPVKALLRLEADRMAPNDLIRAILTAPVDLLWFGGIGTYVCAAGETNAEIGDRANDALRVSGRELRAKVVGEGANLAMTQRARIDYGLAGGRCNSDAIDNSAGVNTSDVEVNIKIAFGQAMRAGKLKRAERDRLLSAMTDSVAALVLRNNYLQTLAISVSALRRFEDFPFQVRLIQNLEARGILNRRVETLPDDAALAERQTRDQPLTRAEIGVLLAYAKITLYDELLAGTLPDDKAMRPELFGYFPEAMQKPWKREIETHRLHREIIATGLANAIINRGGPTFLARVADRTGADASAVARAFCIVRAAFDIEDLHAGIDRLDARIGGLAQLRLYLAVQELILSRTVWFLRNVRIGDDLAALAATYAKAVAAIDKGMAANLPEALSADIAAATLAHLSSGVPAELAGRLARLPALAAATDIHLIAEKTGAPKARATEAWFAVGEHFRIALIEQVAGKLATSDYFDGLALDRALQRLSEAQRAIAVEVLSGAGAHGGAFTHWMEKRGASVERIVARVRQMTEGEGLTISRVTVAANLLAELALELK